MSINTGIDIDSIKSIKYNNVEFSYDNKKILNNINLKIVPNSVNVIVGESGSGKTTLINLLLAQEKLENGNILVNGIDIKDINIDSLRARVSYVPQDIPIFNDSVINNILLGEDVKKDDICSLMDKVGLNNYILSLKDGYDTIMDLGGENFSGGQCQKIAIARALVKNSDLIIFDEPTSNLDNTSTKVLLDCIKNECKQKTIILISHNLESINKFENINFLYKGQIAGHGNHGYLMKNNINYRELYKNR